MLTIETDPSPPLQPAEVDALNWRTYSSTAAADALVLWSQLAKRIQNASITTHPAWVKSWLDQYGDIIGHRFLIAESAGIVRGIALLTDGVGRKNGPFPVRSLHVGTAGEPQLGSVCVEYNRLLVEKDYETPFVQGLGHAILNNTSWEMFCLDGLSEVDLQVWLKLFPQASIRSRESLYFNFSATRAAGQDILSRLGSSTRSNIRRRLKKYGELETTWATTLSEAEQIFNELVTLHQARWNSVGHPGAFANRRFLAFQRQLLRQLVSTNRVVLFRVRHEGETVGSLMLLVDQDRMLDYLSGFADFEKKPSIGLITHYLCMEQGLAKGYAAYDFLVGDKQHKNNLSTDCNQLCWLTYDRPSLKSHTVKTLRKVKHFIGASSLFS